ncbi:MAG: MotA/TolQ/ExbB proton channel family protein [Phycisphaerales bacterium]|nr:MotA/TolQ/ExbB proton channel family protein [Phycisphaerales bacterium]
MRASIIAMLDQAIQFFQAGGWVMYPLLLMSVLSLTLIFERFIFWGLVQRRGPSQLMRYMDQLQQLGRDELLKRSSRDRTLEGRLVDAALKDNTTSDSALIGHIEMLRSSIERFSPTLGTVIAAAPLLGILGTVTGIIQSFDLLGEAASVSDPAIVAGGIAEALYTTAFGLSIALVTLFPHVYYKVSADRALGRLELLAGAIADRQPSPNP